MLLASGLFDQGSPLALGRDGRFLTQFALFLVSHLEKEQVGELLQVVAVRDAVVAQDVAIVPDPLDN